MVMELSEASFETAQIEFILLYLGIFVNLKLSVSMLFSSFVILIQIT